MRQQAAAHLEILNGWKEIANYLGKGVRTVQRYERELRLPVRRPARKKTGSVLATKVELDAWVNASPIRESFPLPKGELNTPLLLTQLRRHVTETQRLRQETVALRHAVQSNLWLLQENLRIALPKAREADSAPLTDSEHGAVSNVLTFDPKRKKAN